MEKLENISKDIWAKAFLFTDLESRLNWALNERNDLERIHELAENPKLNPYKVKTIGEFTKDGFVEKEASPPKAFSETLTYKAIFNLPNGPKRPYSYDKVEALTDVINHTYDKIYFRDKVESKLHQFDKDIDKDMFLIDCKSDDNLIFGLKYWGRNSWRKVVESFMEERETGVKLNKEILKPSKNSWNCKDKIWLLDQIGFFTSLFNQGWKDKDKAKIVEALTGYNINNIQNSISHQHTATHKFFRPSKSKNKVKALLEKLPQL